MCNRQAFQQKWHAHHHKYGRHGGNKFERWAKARGFGRGQFQPPVNVQEFDDRYELALYAPELERSDFQINLKDQVLTIAAEKKVKEGSEPVNWRRKEFSAGGFKRQFELNDKIDVAAISAAYADGVLRLTLPKREGFETQRQEISIA